MKTDKKKLLTLSILIVFFAILSTALMYLPPVKSSINLINNLIYDLNFKIKIAGGGKRHIEDVVIIDIDDMSIKKLGRFSSWPMSYYGDVVKYISEGGAKSIGFDVFFTEPDSLSNKILSYYISEIVKKVNFSKSEIREILKELNTEPNFAESIRNSGIVYLGAFDNYFKNILTTIKLPSNMFQIPIGKIKNIPELNIIRNPNFPVLSIRKAAKKIGFAHISPDADGTTRNYEGLFKYNNFLVTNFSLQMVLDDYSIDSLQFTKQNCIFLSKGENVLTVPIDSKGRTFLNFYGRKKKFRYISFSDVILKRISKDFFKNKFILIGSSAIGLNDLKTIPIDQNYPGVELHATFIKNAIDNNFISTVSYSKLYFAIALVIIFAFFIFNRKSLIWTVISFPLLTVGLLLFTYAEFAYNNEFWNFGLFFYYYTAAFITTILYRYKTELIEKQKVKKTFSHYLPKSIMQEMLTHPEKLKLGGEYKIITALFTDIKSFTTLSENIPPDILTKFLKEYMTQLTNAVFKNQGMLDKYIGDAIVALFGVPISVKEHAQKACFAAIEMKKLSTEIAKKYEKYPQFKNFRTRFGINTGNVIAGNMGSEQLFDYTGIGDNMNLAARLEALNKYYGTEILISEFTRKELHDNFLLREIDSVIVKGKTKGVKIFELVGLKTEFDNSYLEIFEKSNEIYNSFLHYYYSGVWAEAIKYLNEILEINPQDSVCLYMKKQLENYNNCAPNNWNGSFVMESK